MPTLSLRQFLSSIATGTHLIMNNSMSEQSKWKPCSRRYRTLELNVQHFNSPGTSQLPQQKISPAESWPFVTTLSNGLTLIRLNTRSLRSFQHHKMMSPFKLPEHSSCPHTSQATDPLVKSLRTTQQRLDPMIFRSSEKSSMSLLSVKFQK